MISTRSVELVIDTVVCLTLAKWETVSGQFGGYLNDQTLIIIIRILEQPLNSLSADLYELFSKVFAVQQPKECFWHAFDPLKHVFSLTQERVEALWRWLEGWPPLATTSTVSQKAPVAALD